MKGKRKLVYRSNYRTSGNSLQPWRRRRDIGTRETKGEGRSEKKRRRRREEVWRDEWGKDGGFQRASVEPITLLEPMDKSGVAQVYLLYIVLHPYEGKVGLGINGQS
ncbi:unnamed protein product [Cuscuta europaea]|uniref:Uncharacterized protein n=1 Tax=Cuscuta europaea TaxID=41803 RepID=A0A9P0ZY81_CUSEU|nr:unnamed protein product [Cuscuta europaea]